MDECPPNVECVGDYSTCGGMCARVYTVSVAQSGNGSHCEAADQSVGQCSPGQDLCPVGSCQGSWSICQADCGNKTYSVTVPATGGGASCPAIDGASDDEFCIKNDKFCIKNDHVVLKMMYYVLKGAGDACAPGEDACPPDIVSINDEICIKTEELCIKSEGLCIKNDEFCRTVKGIGPSAMRTVPRCTAW